MAIALRFKPCSSASKESTCNAGDPSLIPGLGRSPEEGNGNPLQYSCLEKPTDRSLAGSYSPWGHFCLSRLLPPRFGRRRAAPPPHWCQVGTPGWGRECRRPVASADPALGGMWTGSLASPCRASAVAVGRAPCHHRWPVDVEVPSLCQASSRTSPVRRQQGPEQHQV